MAPGGPARAPAAARPGGAISPPPARHLPQGAGRRPGGNLLAERFLEVGEFRASYEEAYRSLYQQLFADGAALEALDSWAQTLAGVAGELVDASTLSGRGRPPARA